MADREQAAVAQGKEELKQQQQQEQKADELTEEQQQAHHQLEEEQMQEMMGSVFSTKRPKDAMAGLASGLKTIGKGACVGAAILVAAPIQGAREEGFKGFCKGLAAGIVGAVAMPATAAAVGAAHMRRGLYNTPNSFAQRANGKEWDEQSRTWIT